MPFVQAEKLQTYYEKIGSGPVLILLHGWANTWEAWLPLIPYLSDHYTLIIPDLPSFGKSQGPEHGFTTKEYANWLHSFVDSVVKTTPIIGIIGHSFGGKVALVYQSTPHVHAAEKLILIDASGIPIPLTPSQHVLRIVSLLTPAIVKKALPTSQKQKAYTLFGGESDYAVATNSQKHTLKKILPEDITADAKHITVPTLLVWGSQNKIPPLWVGEQFHSVIPNSTLVVFDSGHFPHHEYPEKVAKKILDFLESTE